MEICPRAWSGPLPSSLSFGGRSEGDTDSSYEIETPTDTSPWVGKSKRATVSGGEFRSLAFRAR